MSKHPPVDEGDEAVEQHDPTFEEVEEAAEQLDPLIADIMITDVYTVGPEATLHDLVGLFSKYRISGAPVVDEEGRLLGIVTEGDIIVEDADIHFPHYFQIFDAIIYLGSMKKYEERVKKAVGVYVKDVMTTDVLTVQPNDRVRVAATIMAKHRIDRVPVVDDDGKLVGLVGRHEIIASLGI
jgi:CBS domain-containing protein